MSNWLVSIGAGFAVLGIVWVAKLLWTYIISPTIENLTYKGIKIEGEWQTTFGDQSRRPDKELVSLQRRGTSVKGTIQCTECGPSKEDLGKKYDFLGVYKNGYLICIYSIQDKIRMDMGCFCLRSTGDGNSFEGHCIAYYHPDEALLSQDYSWERQK
ncbi:MAG: hypothetical protein ABIK12_04870 [Pseudomonadota bacterium]